MLAGALAAVLMTLFLDLTNPRRGGRLQVRLDISSLPDIHKFVGELARRLGWNESSTDRLLAASEETLMSLVQRGDEEPVDDPPRLMVVARPSAGVVELEFMAVFDEQNLEQRLAHLSEESEGLEEGEVSLRLLRHNASSVQHQKYYGLDIVTMQVKGSP